MTEPNGWPDASKPGVPLNPEKHGWHWLAWDATWPEPAYWDGEWSQPDKSNLSVRTARYLGPCPTPQEVAAREQAAAVAMREACAAQVCAESDDLLALPLPTGALDRLLREAEARGMERAAAIARRVIIPNECSAIEAHGRLQQALACAEAIRAAAVERAAHE